MSTKCNDFVISDFCKNPDILKKDSLKEAIYWEHQFNVDLPHALIVFSN